MQPPTTPADVPRFLMESLPVFVDSPELERLDEELRSIPGLVVGQVTILLRRLQSESTSGKGASSALQDQLREISSALEVLARSSSPEVQNLVVVEVLEHLHATPEELQAILTRFGPSTRGLYVQWIDPALADRLRSDGHS